MAEHRSTAEPPYHVRHEKSLMYKFCKYLMTLPHRGFLGSWVSNLLGRICVHELSDVGE